LQHVIVELCNLLLHPFLPISDIKQNRKHAAQVNKAYKGQTATAASAVESHGIKTETHTNKSA